MIQHDDRTVRAKLLDIDEHGKGLTLWEIDFITDLIDRSIEKFSLVQAMKIDQIHGERVTPEVFRTWRRRPDRKSK